jgi:hypothetical protein
MNKHASRSRCLQRRFNLTTVEPEDDNFNSFSCAIDRIDDIGRASSWLNNQLSRNSFPDQYLQQPMAFDPMGQGSPNPVPK